MNYLEELKSNETIFLVFLSEKYPFHYHSNLFLRDLQYAIHAYFKLKDNDLRFTETEKLAYNFAEHLVIENKLSPVNNFTWQVIIDISPKKEEEKLIEAETTT